MKKNLKKRAEILKMRGEQGRKNPKKRIGIKRQEYNSILYSARKINEKYAPPYSVLKPETSSDSDSLKSKGAR
jgi:hypothetical protein